MISYVGTHTFYSAEAIQSGPTHYLLPAVPCQNILRAGVKGIVYNVVFVIVGQVICQIGKTAIIGEVVIPVNAYILGGRLNIGKVI